MDFASKTISEKLLYGLEITGLGMGVVFTGLILLVFIIIAMGAMNKSKKKSLPIAKQDAQATLPETLPAIASGAVESNIPKAELCAILASSIAATLGTDVSRIRILSSSLIGSSPIGSMVEKNRYINVEAKDELTAVLSATIASTIGSPYGIRIHSIQKLS